MTLDIVRANRGVERLVGVGLATNLDVLVSPSLVLRQKVVDDLFTLQKSDGGWNLATLGPNWKRADGTPQDYDVLDAVTNVARRLGVSNYAVALAWILHQPGITSPIIGATKPHHLGEAIAAQDLKLDADTLAELEAPYVTRPVQGHQ